MEINGAVITSRRLGPTALWYETDQFESSSCCNHIKLTSIKHQFRSLVSGTLIWINGWIAHDGHPVFEPGFAFTHFPA
ncbi:conserved hypothetical protein [Paraburkholderia caribensis]|uniref:hypothetical protein n=1 Tax=Paraburkholderia caribensis TaxID=75105 RepID=UPI001CAC83A4|nr:hypothetical protein [Paraburkholderia caribensis]CAG9237716.1 conserved hypothetical protein [Paraburkholderia caribensis]